MPFKSGAADADAERKKLETSPSKTAVKSTAEYRISKYALRASTAESVDQICPDIPDKRPAADDGGTKAPVLRESKALPKMRCKGPCFFQGKGSPAPGRSGDIYSEGKTLGNIKSICVLEPGCDLATRIERRTSALTAPELADLLGLGKTAIYNLAKRGGIPHYRVAGSIRFDPATTAAWLRNREIAFPERRAA